MSLSGAEQASLQEEIESKDIDEKFQMRIKAENFLFDINSIMDQRKLTNEELRRSEIAIEIIVRIEAAEKNKGWFFRVKRRVQLVRSLYRADIELTLSR